MNKATEIMVGAGAGAVASVILDLLKLLIAEAEIVFNFRYASKEFTTTMKDLQPILEKIERLGKADDLNTLKVTLEKARDLVQRCSRVTKWQVIKKSIYTRKIWKIQKAMVSFCQVQLPLLHHASQLETIEDIKNLKVMMKGIDNNYNIFIKKLDHFVKAISNFFQIVNTKLDDNHREIMLRLKSLGPSNRASVYRPLCPVPGMDKPPVGFDWPLVKLKKKLLDNSVDCLVVSAAPGCGKTTLVTMLCHDKEIKKFKHIFFNVVSSAPNFRKLVQNLLKHNGEDPPTFDDDNQASTGLQTLLQKLGKDGPILMVLDDVWHGAESLLRKFKQNDLPGYKILVTSRVGFLSFGPTFKLKSLNDKDARALFIQWASRPPNASEVEYEKLLKKILKRCKGVPIVIEVVGSSLKGELLHVWKAEVKSWSQGKTLLGKHASLLECLQPSFSALDPNLKECFLDMGSFLEDKKIRASVIIDIQVELDGNGSTSTSTVYMNYLSGLASQNLLKLIPLRRKEPEDGFYNEFLVTQHDVLRELAISQSEVETVVERERLNLEIREDTFPNWCSNLKTPINARLLTISTDDLLSSNWVEMDCPNVEALILHISSSSDYALPEFISRMKKLKIVVIINHRFHPVRVSNLSYLKSLPNLKRIRLERISITFLEIIQLECNNLKKLSLYLCSFGKISHDTQEINVSEALRNLQEVDIDYCYDLVELPSWITQVFSLNTLSITNCSKFSTLPEYIGNLSKLQELRLCSCNGLSELPETIDSLNKLQFLDISKCFQLKKLPLRDWELA